MMDKTITLYHFKDGKFIRSVIENCFYYDSKSANFSKTGIINTDTFKVIISTNKDIEIKEGKDIVVKGICDFEFNNESEKTQSESLKEFNSKYESYTVTSASKNLFGGLSNIELSCK